MNIRDLIGAARDGRSFEQLAAADPGSPNRQRWQQLATGKKPVKEFPEPRTIIAMAKVLHVSPQTILLAFAEELGLPLRPSSRLEAMLPPGVEQLGDDALRAVIANIRIMVRAEVVGAEEYDYDQIKAARTNREVPRTRRSPHIDPVEQDGPLGED